MRAHAPGVVARTGMACVCKGHCIPPTPCRAGTGGQVGGCISTGQFPLLGQSRGHHCLSLLAQGQRGSQCSGKGAQEHGVHAHQPRHRWVCTPGATGAHRRCLCWGVCPSARALVRAKAPAAAQQGCHPPQPAVILTDNNPAVPELGWAGAALAVAAQFSYQLCWCFPHLLHTKGLQCWSWLCRALVSLCWDPLWIPGDGAGGPWEPQPTAWDLPQGMWAGILPGF